MNKRIPNNPDDKHVLLVIDEVPMLLKIPGMAEEIGKISPQYRSRRLQIIVIIQALWQLEENLRDQIWSMGNVICFGIDDFNEAYLVSQQLFNYDPQSIKLEPASASGQPIIETDRGQYLTAAKWIQHLKQREVVMRCYINEGEEEGFIRHIAQTSEKPHAPIQESLIENNNRLLSPRANPVKDALKVIKQRKKSVKNKKQNPTV